MRINLGGYFWIILLLAFIFIVVTAILVAKRIKEQKELEDE